MPRAQKAAVRQVTKPFSYKGVLWVLALLLVLASVPNADADTYLSYFYTPGDAIVFLPEAGTSVTIRDSAGTVVWSKSSTLVAGEVEDVTGLTAGFHRVTSNKKIVLMAGDMVSGSGTDTRSYYARDVDGDAVGTELYTYLRNSSEQDTPTLYRVFAPGLKPRHRHQVTSSAGRPSGAAPSPKATTTTHHHSL